MIVTGTVGAIVVAAEVEGRGKELEYHPNGILEEKEVGEPLSAGTMEEGEPPSAGTMEMAVSTME